MLAWCDKHGITPKGHPLIWHQYLPDWLSTDPAARAARIRLRFEQIAGRYGDRITMWDTVNEALIRNPDIPLPGDYVQWSFEQAAELFSTSARLFYNDVGWECIDRFHQEYTPMYLLLQNLLLQGGRLDGIGIQHHKFASAEELPKKRDTILDPMRHLRALDRIADFQRPIHISEITIPQYEGIDVDGSLRLFHGRYRISIDGESLPEPFVIDRDSPAELILTIPADSRI